jgi:4'-phosphopantetheinyl transferase
MGTFNIYTRNRLDLEYQNIDNFRFLINDQPVFYIIPIDSYSTNEIDTLQRVLSEKEKEKAFRFRFVRDRNSYIVTHARLRQILGQYLISQPEEIRFVFNDYGKSSLIDNYKIIHFNLSHRSGISIIGFDAKSEVGVDVEIIDPEFDFEPIARTHFTQDENEFIFENPEGSRLRFYTLWTRKEAFLKAVGIGIGNNLDVEVFRGSNQYSPVKPIPGSYDNNFYLCSYGFQQKFMISTATHHPGGFIGLIDFKRPVF